MDKIDAVCGICGKQEIHYIDLIHECFNCGANEYLDEDGTVWTAVPLPIGLILKKDDDKISNNGDKPQFRKPDIEKAEEKYEERKESMKEFSEKVNKINQKDLDKPFTV